MHASNSKFIKWLDQSRENIRTRREQRLVLKNTIAHKHKGLLSSRKVVESFVAPPPFLVYVWGAFPLLLISTFSTSAILSGIIATIINFILIHRDTYNVVRVLMCGVVLLIILVLYHLDII